MKMSQAGPPGSDAKTKLGILEFYLATNYLKDKTEQAELCKEYLKWQALNLTNLSEPNKALQKFTRRGTMWKLHIIYLFASLFEKECCCPEWS